MTRQWLGQQVSDTDFHVVPLDDLLVHDFSQTCACGPRSRVIVREGPDGWVHTHHSLDGRELNEFDYGTDPDA
ncbi:hypothetical protein [Streptomyces sp. NPDC085596]|uniref:hypothetical protein n=1 Tax=Streptomyces sp. NPDC085596 TaxID=3365731 RepID=UPI0037D0B0FB